jgi:hypothetical protein
MVSTWMGARYTLQNGGNVVTLVFGGVLFQAEFLWNFGFVCGFIREWMKFRAGKTVAVVMNGGCLC